jgi:hypothetical protein
LSRSSVCKEEIVVTSSGVQCDVGGRECGWRAYVFIGSQLNRVVPWQDRTGLQLDRHEDASVGAKEGGTKLRSGWNSSGLYCTVERKKVSRFSSWFGRFPWVGRFGLEPCVLGGVGRMTRAVVAVVVVVVVNDRSAQLAHWELLADRSATGVCSDCHYCYDPRFRLSSNHHFSVIARVTGGDSHLTARSHHVR